MEFKGKNNYRTNIDLCHDHFIDMGPLAGDSRIKMEAQRVKSRIKCLSQWFNEAFFKRCPNEEELQAPTIPCLNVEKGILRLREIANTV